MQRANPLEKAPVLGKIEGWRKRGWQKMEWLDSITDMKVKVSQSCPTLCNPMDSSIPGFPVHHWSLFKLMSIESVMPSNYLILYHPLLLLLSILPSIRVFPMSHFFASDGQSIGVSASASVLPMNIQKWIPLGLTGLISLQSKSLLQHHSSKASILQYIAYNRDSMIKTWVYIVSSFQKIPNLFDLNWSLNFPENVNIRNVGNAKI